MVRFVLAVGLAGSLSVRAAAAQKLDATSGGPRVSDSRLEAHRRDLSAQSVELAVEYTSVSDRLSTVTTQLAGLDSRLAAAQQAFETSAGQYRAISDQIDAARARLRGRAVASYEDQRQLIGSELDIGRVQLLAEGTAYVRDEATADLGAVRRLNVRAAPLKTIRDAKAQLVRGLQTEETSLRRQRDELSAQASTDQETLESLGGVPVMGASRLSAAQMVAWFDSTGRTARLSGGTTIGELTALYIDEGSAASVRADLAFAQAIVETGFFGHATDNNYAGIGACDTCQGEPSFPSPRAGVRAQVQLLRSYADPASTAATLGYPPDPTLFGNDVAGAASTFDSFTMKGRVPLWNQMGHGNWATDPDYAGKVLKVYLEMLTFAHQHD